MVLGLILLHSLTAGNGLAPRSLGVGSAGGAFIFLYPAIDDYSIASKDISFFELILLQCGHLYVFARAFTEAELPQYGQLPD